MEDKTLYQVVLYSIHYPVEILASNLDLEQTKDFISKYKTDPHTMIGIWNQQPSESVE